LKTEEALILTPPQMFPFCAPPQMFPFCALSIGFV